MNLKDNKKIMLSLIEEYSPENEFLTNDEDIKKRINLLYNTSYQELAQVKKIRRVKNISKTISSDDHYTEYSLPFDMYQLENVVALDTVTNKPVEPDYMLVGNKILINDNSNANYRLLYFAYPSLINEDTTDDFELEIDQDVQNLLPYAVASDILKSDPSADYAAFEQKYQNKKSAIDIRVTMPTAIVENKYNI